MSLRQSNKIGVRQSVHLQWYHPITTYYPFQCWREYRQLVAWWGVLVSGRLMYSSLFLSMWVFAEEGYPEWRCQSEGFCMKRTSMHCTNYHHINDYPARIYNLVQTRLFICQTFRFNSKLRLPKMIMKKVWETRGNLVTKLVFSRLISSLVRTPKMNIT